MLFHGILLIMLNLFHFLLQSLAELGIADYVLQDKHNVVTNTVEQLTFTRNGWPTPTRLILLELCIGRPSVHYSAQCAMSVLLAKHAHLWKGI